MTGETKKSDAEGPNLELSWDDDGDGEGPPASNRPTMAPPFDLATYAKEAMVPSTNVTPPGMQAPAQVLQQAAPPAEPTPTPGGSPGTDVKSAPSRTVSLPPPPPLANRAPLPRSVSVPPPPAEVAAPPAPRNPPPQRITARALPIPTPMETPRPTGDGEAAPVAIMTPVPPSSSPPSQRITPQEMQRLDAALIKAREEQLRGGPPPHGDTLLALANQRATLLTPPRVQAVAMPSPAPPGGGVKDEPVPSVQNPIVEMQERFALGDYSGALVMAESMLDENPSHVEAREYAESCRAVLQQMYTARIGPLDRVPVVEIARDQLRWLSIDHRTGFILSLVDGVSSLEMILDVCGMPPLDALRMLFELVQQRIISIRDE